MAVSANTKIRTQNEMERYDLRVIEVDEKEWYEFYKIV